MATNEQQERDLQAHAKTITVLVESVGRLETAFAVMTAKNEYRDEKIDWLLKLVWLIASAIILGFISLGFAFISGKIHVG